MYRSLWHGNQPSTRCVLTTTERIEDRNQQTHVTIVFENPGWTNYPVCGSSFFGTKKSGPIGAFSADCVVFGDGFSARNAQADVTSVSSFWFCWPRYLEWTTPKRLGGDWMKRTWNKFAVRQRGCETQQRILDKVVPPLFAWFYKATHGFPRFLRNLNKSLFCKATVVQKAARHQSPDLLRSQSAFGVLLNAFIPSRLLFLRSQSPRGSFLFVSLFGKSSPTYT